MIGKVESTAATRYLRSCALNCGAVVSSMFKWAIVTGIAKRKIDATSFTVVGRRADRSGGDPGPESGVGRNTDSNLPLADLVRHRTHAAGVRTRELDRKN